MAGLKKKKREKNPNPNVVIIIFLVFFVLVSIGLGIWGYYGYADQAQLRSEKNKQKDVADSEKLSARFYSMVSREARLALGEILEDKEKEQLTVDRDEFYKDANGGKFKDLPDKDMARKLNADLRDALGGIDEARNLKQNYRQRLKAAEDKAAEMEGKLNASVAKQKYIEELSAEVKAAQVKFYAAAEAAIATGNKEALAAVKKNADEVQKLVENNRGLNEELAAKAQAYETENADWTKQRIGLEKQIKILQAEKKELLAMGGGPGGAPNAGGRPSGDTFPLLLDISPGKPLWDAPVGKIVRVDLEARQVIINVGSSHGAKPELTFNVFGPGVSGRAEKQMKGSLEIVKVLGPDSSAARITSLYDAEGKEILLNIGAVGRFLRETEAPMREGDLLFNLFWGTRVAVAGYVSITGEPSDDPEEQARQMKDFMILLKRNGITVDAYVDMRDGLVKGNITPRTRYLIRGTDTSGGVAKTPEDKEKEKEKEKEKDKDMDKEKALVAKEKNMEKEPIAKDPRAGVDRLENIGKSNQLLRNEAKANGLLMISAENFAVVIGYRKARNMNSPEIVTFRPSLPYAGEGIGGVHNPDAPPPRPKDKEMEK